MTTLDDEIAAYGRIKHDLETNHRGEWVVIHDRRLFGTFRSFQDAAYRAVKAFGRGPYLIRQIGAASVSPPVSVLYAMTNGTD